MLVNFFSKSTPSSNQNSGKYIGCKSFINDMSSTGIISKLAWPRPMAEMGAPANWEIIEKIYIDSIVESFNKTARF